jgi:hypothetical protein
MITSDNDVKYDRFIGTHPQKKPLSNPVRNPPLSGECETQGPISIVAYVSSGELMPLHC